MNPSIKYIFFIFLILYSLTSNSFTLVIHLILLGLGLFISLSQINKFTKNNSLKPKIYFSFLMSFIVFSSIIFFWFLGDHSSIDEKGLTTAVIIIPSALLFMAISLITGIILSIKRNNIPDNTDFRLLNILAALIVLIFFFNPLIGNLAVFAENPSICKTSVSLPSSYMFSPDYESSCLVSVALKTNNENLCENVCDVNYIDEERCNMNAKNKCYVNVASNKKDVNVCLKGNQLEVYEMSYCVMRIAEETSNPLLCEHLRQGNRHIEGLDNWDRNWCIHKVAQRFPNKQLCNDINDEELKEYCINQKFKSD